MSQTLNAGPFDPATEAGVGEASPPAGDPRPPAPGAAHRAEQRRRILNAAVACFARDGFHGASMQKVCAEAGMSPGALYRYFPSKEALIAAIVEDERAERLGLFNEVKLAPSVLGALTECLRVLLEEQVFSTAKLGPEIMAEAIRNTKLREGIAPCDAESRALLREAITVAMARGEVDPALDLEDVVTMVQAIGDGLVLHHQLHPQWNVLERLPQFHALALRMLAPRAPVPPNAPTEE